MRNTLLLVAFLLAAGAVVEAGSWAKKLKKLTQPQPNHWNGEKFRQCLRKKLDELDKIEAGPVLQMAKEHFAALPASELNPKEIVMYFNNFGKRTQNHLKMESYDYNLALARAAVDCEQKMNYKDSIDHRMWFSLLDENDPDKVRYMEKRPLIDITLLFADYNSYLRRLAQR